MFRLNYEFATDQAMKLELDDQIAARVEVDERQALELLAIALYKYKGIHGVTAGKILGVSEFEFHELLSRYGESINYGLDDLIDDIETNNL